MCTGAAYDGSLDVSVEEIERRCSADAQCAGYAYAVNTSLGHPRGRTTFNAVPLVHFTNWLPALPGYELYVKEDLCALKTEGGPSDDASGRVDGGGGAASNAESAALTSMMAQWAEHAWSKVRHARVRAATNRSVVLQLDEKLESIMSGFRAFGAEAMPNRLRHLPVFYPFAGFDVLTVRAFFPHAPKIVLTSSIPFGDVACFLDAPCRGSLTRATMANFADNWAWHDFAWSDERTMHKLLIDQPRLVNDHNATFGVAPMLLVSLAALGVRLTDITRRAGTNIVTLHASDGLRLVYAARGMGWRALKDDLHTIDELLLDTDHTAAARAEAKPGSLHHHGGGAHEHAAAAHALSSPPPPPLFALMMKAAAEGWAYLRQPELYTHILHRSAAVLTDETGFPPSVYDRHAWRVEGYGEFARLEDAYTDLGIITPWRRHPSKQSALHNASLVWRDEMRSFFAHRKPLPFIFGYGSERHGPGAHGVMLVGWRHAHGGARTGNLQDADDGSTAS